MPCGYGSGSAVNTQSVWPPSERVCGARSTTRGQAFRSTKPSTVSRNFTPIRRKRVGMRRLKVREEAIADLADIYNHIARVSGSYVSAIGFVRRYRRAQRPEPDWDE
jgi:hypothetical protein